MNYQLVIDKIDNFIRAVERLQIQQDTMSDEVKQTEASYQEQDKQNDLIQQAHLLLDALSKATVSRVKETLETLGTLALQSVYGDEIRLVVQYEEKPSGAHEVKLLVQEGAVLADPMQAYGGGVCDVLSLAFRIAFLYIYRPRLPMILILDEPLKWVGALSNRAGEFLQRVSDKLGIQIIILTHIENLMDIGDKSHIIKEGDTSYVQKDLT